MSPGTEENGVHDVGAEGKSGPDTTFGLLRALRNAAVSVFYQDPDLRVIWARNVPVSWMSGEIVGLTDEDFLPPKAGALVAAEKRAAIAGKAPRRLEIHVPGEMKHDDKWYDLWIDPDTAPDARGTETRLRGVITTVVEITAHKQREHTLRVLLREVSHRSRNMLAIIQSIAMQTGRHAMTVDGFLLRFRGRLQSLASSQDLVTSSNWRGAALRDLVHGQAARYTAEPELALRLEGENPWLSPNAALHVGLALHELIANSVSYGALSRRGGHVSVRAIFEPDAGGATALRLAWEEEIAPEAGGKGAEIQQKRFGSAALERIVPAALNGSARLAIGSDRLEYSLIVPAGNFEFG